jgi:hypothetical protein
MKFLKGISTIAFFIGIMMVAGAIGADDAAVAMHQAHQLDLCSIVIGMLACIPFVFVHGVM